MQMHDIDILSRFEECLFIVLALEWEEDLFNSFSQHFLW
jgi:hypothetical protein